MNRRRFLKISTVSAVGLLAAGTAYRFFQPSDPLDNFYQSTKTVLTGRFGKQQAGTIVKEIKTAYAGLVPSVPYIGGKKNIFTEWLDYGVYYLAAYNVLKKAGLSVDQVGEIIFRTYETMADYPKWLLKRIGKLKYGESYISHLKAATEKSQLRRYPGDWVCEFVTGNGQDFDYGLDITDCGICKFYKAHNVEELAPFMCLSDYVVSKAFDRGLVRYHTVAEGDDRCDFRFKAGRETFVNPLRDGWPPKF
ncbi:MAG: L-2-amino-thiazoline-4-carboxylic acid hydrolase [Deltaproteobacteria bacterium]|nr:L-2-amino-thiazoline-4-carboxylic acid hydrolase [Deltaproteobacteria bacterium]